MKTCTDATDSILQLVSRSDGFNTVTIHLWQRLRRYSIFCKQLRVGVPLIITYHKLSSFRHRSCCRSNDAPASVKWSCPAITAAACLSPKATFRQSQPTLGGAWRSLKLRVNCLAYMAALVFVLNSCIVTA